MEEWKTEEQEVSKKLESLRLEASTAQQKESFASETLDRLNHEMEALRQEEGDIHETLTLWQRGEPEEAPVCGRPGSSDQNFRGRGDEGESPVGELAGCKG